jgi:PIN domain nuclease of toxin-antitoxin system
MVLLDTHTFIWWDSEPEKLSQRALELCKDSLVIRYYLVLQVFEGNANQTTTR